MIVQAKYLRIVEYYVPDKLVEAFMRALDLNELETGTMVEEWLMDQGQDPEGTEAGCGDYALTPHSVIGATVSCLTDDYDEIEDNG